jgi:hypothetical protein
MFLNIKALFCAGVFLFCINAMAAENAQAGPGAAQPQEKANASVKKGAEKVIGGVITNINAEKKEFSVLRNNEQYPIQVMSSTQIFSGKDPIDFSSIAVGDKVTVNYKKLSNGARNAVTIEKKASGPSSQPAMGQQKHKAQAKSASTKVEVSAPKAEAPAAPVAPKAEVKAEPKKAEAAPAAPAAPKAEVKAEPKKAEAAPAAPAAPKAEVKAAPKKAEATAVPAAPKKAEAPAVPAKTETKPAPK